MDEQVWKIPINQRRDPDFVFSPNEPDKFEPGKVERAREFCFKDGWVGIGWGLVNIDRDLDEHEDYLHALETAREDEIGFPPETARAPCLAFAVRMQNGDFIWCRAAADIYWLGRVEGPWRYRHNGQFDNFDLYQVRKCKWVRVGASDLVPGPIKNAYAGRGQALSRILKEKDAALLGSALIWKFRTGENVDVSPREVSKLPLGAIAHDDLEDIVALYLQIEMGWNIIPSTVKKSTPITEFVLRNRAGHRAYVQVKSGQSTIDAAAVQIPPEVDKFFLFYPTIDEDTKLAPPDSRAIYINADKLTAFVRENQALMSEFVRSLVV